MADDSRSSHPRREMTAEQVKAYCDRYRHLVRQDEDAPTLIRKVWRDAFDAALSEIAPSKEEIETMLDNAACASQVQELCRDLDGKETALREAVRLNVVEPLMRRYERPERAAPQSDRSNKGTMT